MFAAAMALDGRLPDTVNGATHYHALSVRPPWARGQAPCAALGNHLFYDLGVTG
jgi:spore germination cell wall hydrolase CwlJ-like protein